MKLFCIRTLVTVLALYGAAAQATVATFEGLSTRPDVISAVGLEFANGGSLDYAGVTWDSRFSVVGDEYRVSSTGPVFGMTKTAHYSVTNQDGANGLMITTNKILENAWFGRNEYYGFGGGADQISIYAMGASGVLASVVFDLPELLAGLAEELRLVDTSAFGNLSGITGYRIDRRQRGEFLDNWVADNFKFRDNNPIPEPGSLWLALGGFLFLAQQRLKSRRG